LIIEGVICFSIICFSVKISMTESGIKNESSL